MIKLWDVRTKACMETFKGHSGGVSALRFTPDGQ